MGLLRASDAVNKGDFSKDFQDELAQVRREMQQVRRHNDSLVSQVNNLLHFINEQNRRKQELQQRITINSKSGLPNHNKMDQELEAFFGAYADNPDRRPGAMVLIKLDNTFDIITKTLKPSVSEWIIYQIGTRIREMAGEKAPVFHTRDDEFLLIMDGRGNPGELTSFLEELCGHIGKPHIFTGYHITISCRIGVSFFPMNGTEKSRLLNNADIALNFAKSNNRKYVFFEDHMRDDVVHKMELQNSIIKALEEQSIKEIDKQFFIMMQPVVTAREIRDGTPIVENIDAEALIRWNHPEKGNIAPDAFISIAEETGLIVILGKWVLYTATAQIESWTKGSAESPLDSRLAINVSPKQFHNDDLIDSVQRIISYRSIDPDRLQIEITENSFLDDPDEASRKINRLKDLGIRIAIDDFGTGFSSVNYLRKLPVDVVKIDRSFISNITTSSQDQSIVKAMIAMSSELGMTNVVEGVETLEQIRLLMGLGIERFQGFYFAKPLISEDFRRYYTEQLTLSGQ